MKRCSTALSRAFVLSLAVHAAAVGTALAFAHYGGVWSGDPFRTIMVSLVGEGEAGGRAKRNVARVPQRPAPQAPVADTNEPSSAPAEDDVLPMPETAMRDLAPAAAAPGGNGASSGSDGMAIPAGGQGGEPAFGISAEMLQELRIALEKAKTYPRLARERGLEGTVLLKFRVLPSGDVEAVDVVKSSGERILDDASVRTVYRAAPMPFVKGWVEVPMVYQLKRED